MRSRTLPALLLSALALSLAPADVPAAGRLSEAARWLQDYLRIDTTNPPGGEERAAAFLAELLHREGIETRLLTSPGGRTSLYARLEAERPDAPAIVLLHHIDVVPAGEGWREPPFSGRVIDGRMWGRGAVDAKSLGIAQLAAMIDLARRDVPLARDLVYLATADEEQGGGEGLGWILERHADLLGEIEAVYNEGGANRAVAGRPIWAGIEVAQKRPLWLSVRTTGRGGHGSGLVPRSATHKLVDALARAIALEPRYRVSPAARAYFGALAPLHGEILRPVMADPDAYVTPEGPKVSLLPGMVNLFLDTFQVTVLEAGDKINVISTEASAQIDVRLLPDTDAEAYLDRLQEALGPDVEVEVILTSPPAEPSPTDTAAYRAAARVLGEGVPVVPAFISGFTDSRRFRERGIPAYGVSPFFLQGEDLRGIHGVDEAISVPELDRGVERMKRLVALAVADGAPGEDGVREAPAGATP